MSDTPYVHVDNDGDKLTVEAGVYGAVVEATDHHDGEFVAVALRPAAALRFARELLEAAGFVADFPTPKERDDA